MTEQEIKLQAVQDNSTSKSSHMPNVVVRLVGPERLFCFDFAFKKTLRLVLTKRCCRNAAEEVNKICCKTQQSNFLFIFCKHWA